MTRPLRRVAALACVTAAVLPAAAAHAGASAMTLGFSDLQTFQNGSPADRPLELEHLRATRASALRIMWSWAQTEKVKPPTDAAAADPGYGGYDFSDLDDMLRATAAAGVEPLLLVNRAPDWWEGAARPAVSRAVPRGTWKPDPAAYGRFMTAVAKRYSGSYPDPLHPGQSLPRVRQWQIWNEPNLYVELNPQWKQSGGQWVPASPDLYRGLLAAGYDAVKSVAADNTVVTAGTAPYGEATNCMVEQAGCAAGGPRVQPARFVRGLLCVDGRTKLTARNCRSRPAKFDVLAHHPYPIGPPGRHAINPDDVVVPDIAKLTGPLKVALKAGNVFPKTKNKPVWATEMSWDSNPPDPGGIPAAQQAQYAAGAIYVLWRQGVSRLYWWNLRDDAKGSDYTNSLQSGVYYHGATVAQDTAKPAYTAFRFPFVAYRAYSNFQGHGSAKLWGMAPATGKVQIQRRVGSSWKTVTTATAGGDHVFRLRLPADRGTRLRAVQAGEASIDAKVF